MTGESRDPTIRATHAPLERTNVASHRPPLRLLPPGGAEERGEQSAAPRQESRHRRDVAAAPTAPNGPLRRSERVPFSLSAGARRRGRRRGDAGGSCAEVREALQTSAARICLRIAERGAGKRAPGLPIDIHRLTPESGASPGVEVSSGWGWGAMSLEGWGEVARSWGNGVGGWTTWLDS